MRFPLTIFVKNCISTFFENPLFAGSMVLFLGNMIANGGSYFYHLLMGRMLGPANYGTLESLISLIYLLGIPMITLNLVIVKFASSFKGQKNFTTIKAMFDKFNHKFLLFGAGSLVIFLLLISPISSFLHLKENFSLIIIGGVFFVSIFNTINRGFLQGLLRLNSLSTSLVIESSLKFILAVLFVWWGWNIMGAILPFLIGGIIAYFFTLGFMKKALGGIGENGDIDYRSMISYAFPVFLSTLAFTSLYTTDVILARHFLLPQEAGFYAALSVLGKIIFFAASPVVMVMFPLISERHANGKQYKSFLFLSLGLVFFICLGVSLLYLAIPELMMKILFGSQYLVASSSLFLFGVFLSFYSLSFLLTNFYLSIKEVKIVTLPIIAALVQIIFIFLYHQNLNQIVWISIMTTALLFASQMLYYFYALKDSPQASFSHRSSL